MIFWKLVEIVHQFDSEHLGRSEDNMLDVGEIHKYFSANFPSMDAFVQLCKQLISFFSILVLGIFVEESLRHVDKFIFGCDLRRLRHFSE